MDSNGDDEPSYGQDSRSSSGGGSSSSDLEDIENELYSRIYYRSSEAIGATAAIDADPSARAAVDGATAAVHACPVSTDEKGNGDIVVVSDDAAEDVKEVEQRSCVGTEANAEAGTGRPRRRGRQAAAATVDLTRELDERSKLMELGDLSPDEYVVLSSADDDEVVIASRARPSHTSSVRLPLDSSKLTIESDDDSGDYYEIDDSCDFEFNRLAQTPRSTTTFFGTLREVLASLPPHSWRISDADRYPESFRSRYYNTRCKRCNEKGHAVRDCRKPVKPPACIQCGMQGHVQWSCKRQLCINCGQFGHVLSTCTLKHRKLLYCQRCHRRGHLDEGCSELWRQFHWVSKPDAYKNVSCKPSCPVGVNKVRYCANCGMRGHFLHDCKALQPNPFRPAPSVFVNVYRNESARRGGTPNVKATRKAIIRDSIVSASAVRPTRRRSFTETGLAEADGDVGASPVRKKRGDGRLRTPAAAAVPADESHLSTAGRKQKRRLRAEQWDASRRASVAGTNDVNATDSRSPEATAVNISTGDSPNGDATAPVRNAAAAAAELEAASSTAVPPWEQHDSSIGERRVSSPLKRPWLYDRSPADVQPRGALGDSNDVELVPAKRRHLVDSRGTELDRSSVSASKTPGKKKPGLTAKSRSPNEMEPGRTAELQSGKKHDNRTKSPGGKQPGRAAKRKSRDQQPQEQRQQSQQQWQQRQQQPLQRQQQQRQHHQPHDQWQLQQQRQQQQRQQQHQRQQQQRQQHQRQQQQRQQQLQRQQWQPHQQQQQQRQQQHRQQQLQQQQHQQGQHQQRQPPQRKQQQHNGRAFASGQHSSAAPRDPSQRHQRKYWPTAEGRGGSGRAQATSHSYQVVKHGDFTGHYYRSGGEMVVKFDY